MRDKTRLESIDYMEWQHEVGMIHDLFATGMSPAEIREQWEYVLEDIKSSIWGFIGEDYWNQP